MNVNLGAMVRLLAHVLCHAHTGDVGLSPYVTLSFLPSLTIIFSQSKLLSNAQSLFTFTFAFKICGRTYSVYTMEWQYLPHILQDQMLVSGAQDL